MGPTFVFKTLSNLLGNLAHWFCKIIVKCVSNQLYQTGANDRHFHARAETVII